MSADPILAASELPKITAEEKWHFAMECNLIGEEERAQQILLEVIIKYACKIMRKS